MHRLKAIDHCLEYHHNCKYPLNCKFSSLKSIFTLMIDQSYIQLVNTHSLDLIAAPKFLFRITILKIGVPNNHK